MTRGNDLSDADLASDPTASSLFTEERQRRIEDWLRERGRVEVLDLARMLRVSEHTVRRDLLALQKRGLLRRTHGGAVALDTARMDLAARSRVLSASKDAVGRAAAAFVEPGQTVVLDAGSTPLAMARALAVRPLTVITSSLDVAALFADDAQVEIAVTGGAWRRGNRALAGPAAVDMLRQCRADWAVPGACAIDARLGVSAPDEADAALKRAMIDCARRTLVLGDHSKLGAVAPFRVADWTHVHALVLEAPWPEGVAAGVPVHVAGAAGPDAHAPASARAVRPP
jgi:DeoR/GlpR family transcriptional regulator of sugar metabolism